MPSRPVRFRKEGSRNQTTEIGTVYSGGHRNYKLVEYGCTKCEVWRAHREVIEPLPLKRRGMFPVRFDLTVTSVKELTVEVNKLEKRNPIQADGIEG